MWHDRSNKLTQGFPGGSNEFQGWCRQLLYDRQSMKKVIKKINKMESEQAQLITLGGGIYQGLLVEVTYKLSLQR